MGLLPRVNPLNMLDFSTRAEHWEEWVLEHCRSDFGAVLIGSFGTESAEEVQASFVDCHGAFFRGLYLHFAEFHPVRSPGPDLSQLFEALANSCRLPGFTS